MKKNGIFRKILYLISCIWLGCITVKFILEGLDPISTTFMILSYIAIALPIILNIILIIWEKVIYYKAYERYIRSFKYLKILHKERYKLYFKSNNQDIESYTTIIEGLGKMIIDAGEFYISQNLFNEEKRNQVKIILEQTEKLLTTVSNT